MFFYTIVGVKEELPAVPVAAFLLARGPHRYMCHESTSRLPHGYLSLWSTLFVNTLHPNNLQVLMVVC